MHFGGWSPTGHFSSVHFHIRANLIVPYSLNLNSQTLTLDTLYDIFVLQYFVVSHLVVSHHFCFCVSTLHKGSSANFNTLDTLDFVHLDTLVSYLSLNFSPFHYMANDFFSITVCVPFSFDVAIKNTHLILLLLYINSK
jgi:hypothetical protein